MSLFFLNNLDAKCAWCVTFCALLTAHLNWQDKLSTTQKNILPVVPSPHEKKTSSKSKGHHNKTGPHPGNSLFDYLQTPKSKTNQVSIFSVKGGWEHSILFWAVHLRNLLYALASFTFTETASLPKTPKRSRRFLPKFLGPNPRACIQPTKLIPRHIVDAVYLMCLVIGELLQGKQSTTKKWPFHD